jgi:pantoate--beta-alanine ligase
MSNTHSLQVISSVADFQLLKASWEKSSSYSIGFVPTMGALHEGHIKLVERAFSENDFVVVSIFVNPTQFNNPADLNLYPRTLENDLLLLSKVGPCVVFIPAVSTIYPKNDSFQPINLHGLDSVMEGKFRPGHFQGVVHVVHNFFNLIQPNKAYFGKKDFQQLAIIRFMNDYFNFPIEIIACETIREETGLAKSSRNMRLSDAEKKDALLIIETLKLIKKMRSLGLSPMESIEKGIAYFNQGNLQLEYLELVDSNSLLPLFKNWSTHTTCCIAAYCGSVRLIDNLEV